MRIQRQSLMRSLWTSVEGDGSGGAGGGTGGGTGDAGGGAPQGTPSWLDSLPEPIRAWDEVKNSKDPDAFWKQMSDMRSHLGTSLRVPSEHASAEEVAAFHNKLKEKVPGLMLTPNLDDENAASAFYQRLGRPETADKYSIPEFKTETGDVSPGYSEERTKVFQKIAHEAGLTQKQFNKIVSDMVKVGEMEHVQFGETLQKEVGVLKTDWGMAFKDNVEVVKNFLNLSAAPDPIIKSFNNGQVGSSVMKWFHGLATKVLGNGSTFQGDQGRSSNAFLTPNEAAIQISEIRNNPKHPYHNPSDPGHEAAMKRMQELYRMKSPNDADQPV